MSLPLGKIIGEPSDVYHGGDCLSFTRLKVFTENPQLYYRTYVSKLIARTETQALRDGRAIHSLALEGREVFDRQFAAFTMKGPKNKQPVKAAWDLFKAQCEVDGREVIDDPDMIESVCRAIREHPTAGRLFTGGEAEVTWRANISGLPHPCQCRTDYFHPNGIPELGIAKPLVVDLKSVASLSDSDFVNPRKAFLNRRYYAQPGWYLPAMFECGVEWPDWIFCFAETQEPYGVLCLRPDERSIRIGMEHNQKSLLALAESYRADVWPNQPTGIGEIGLPEWFEKE